MATGWWSCLWLGCGNSAEGERLLETEHLLQEKIKASATIGELVNIDEVFRSTFSYQNKALERG